MGEAERDMMDTITTLDLVWVTYKHGAWSAGEASANMVILEAYQRYLGLREISPNPSNNE